MYNVGMRCVREGESYHDFLVVVHVNNSINAGTVRATCSTKTYPHGSRADQAVNEDGARRMYPLANAGLGGSWPCNCFAVKRWLDESSMRWPAPHVKQASNKHCCCLSRIVNGWYCSRWRTNSLAPEKVPARAGGNCFRISHNEASTCCRCCCCCCLSLVPLLLRRMTNFPWDTYASSTLKKYWWGFGCNHMSRRAISIMVMYMGIHDSFFSLVLGPASSYMFVETRSISGVPSFFWCINNAFRRASSTTAAGNTWYRDAKHGSGNRERIWRRISSGSMYKVW